MQKRGKKVFVAMSGGVDSSVSAALLKDAGYDVTGVFIRGWYPSWVSCTWREDRQDAMRVCAKLGIPFFTLDAEEAYKREVVERMVADYSTGRVPNPDIWCNRSIKFGVFLKEALARGADMVATGHYARISPLGEMRETLNPKSLPAEASAQAGQIPNKFQTQNSRTIQLLTGSDKNKDQSYFLWTLTKYDLAHILFPVGDYEKSEVRKLAEQYDLHTADKKDSQGLCFIGELDMRDFLKHFIAVEKGDVLSENGEVIGTHEGAVLYTIGQRHGFTVTKKGTDSGPFYVIAKDTEKNTLTVSEHYQDESEHGVETFTLEQVNWIGEKPAEGKQYHGRVRHRQKLQPCHAENKNGVWSVTFNEPQFGTASGQSLVLYDPNPSGGHNPNPSGGHSGEQCLGGGVIV